MSDAIENQLSDQLWDCRKRALDLQSKLGDSKKEVIGLRTAYLDQSNKDSLMIGGMARALEKLSCLGNGDFYGNSEGNVIAQKALLEYELLEK